MASYREQKNLQSIDDLLSYIANYIDTHYEQRPGDWVLYLRWFADVLVSLEDESAVG